MILFGDEIVRDFVLFFLGPYGDSWKLVEKKVESVSLTDSEAWYVCEGNVFFQCNLSRSTPVTEPLSIFIPHPAVKICCFKKVS